MKLIVHASGCAVESQAQGIDVDVSDRCSCKPPEENYNQPLAGLLYGFSVLDCLGCSTSADGGAGLGTLGFPEPVARRMTAAAGFTRFAGRDFGNPLNAFYEVRP